MPLVIGRGGCGALNLFSPTGGVAKGIFWKKVILYFEE